MALLYHVTSVDSAKSIVNLGKMLRGSSGMFGGGIYFALTEDSHKAHYQGAIIAADVVLGFSLVCRQVMSTMNYTVLRKEYGCDSVKRDASLIRSLWCIIGRR